MKMQTTEEIRKAAEILGDFITDQQRKVSDDSREYQQLQEYYDAVSAFQENEVEV